MPHKLDQSGDSNLQSLHRFKKLYGFPQFVKDASYSEDLLCTDSKPTLYADPREVRQFPIHTKAATYVSHMFFLENGSELHPSVRKTVESRLQKAAQYWGIKNDCEELAVKHANANREAYPDSCYAIVWASNAGHKERRYPLRNAMEVKAAAAWYCDYEDDVRKEFDYHDRSTIAEKILKKATEYGASIGDYSEKLEQACGRGLCDPDKAAEMIRNRVKAASRVSPAIRTMMDKLAELVQNKPKAFLDPGSMRQLASTVDEFDRTHNLVGKYSSLIPTPESVLFEATYSKTAEMVEESCTTLTGSVYSRDQFAKLSAGDVRDVFGDAIASQVCSGLKVDPEKMAELVGTLPRPDAVMFDELMSGKGLAPFGKDAAQQATGFSFEQLKAMSAV